MRTWTFAAISLVTLPGFAAADGILDLLFGGQAKPAKAVAVAPAPPARPTGTHEQVKTIEVKGSTGKASLQTMALSPDGHIYALLSASRYQNWGANGPQGFAAEVQVFDGTGQKVGNWQVGFLAQSINVGPDGTVLVCGDGQAATFDKAGKPVKNVELPHLKELLGDKEKLRAKAAESLKTEIANYEEILKDQKHQRDEILKKDPDYAETHKQLETHQTSLNTLRNEQRLRTAKKEDTAEVVKKIAAATAAIRELNAKESKLTAVEKNQLRQADAMVKTYERMLDQQKKRSVDSEIANLGGRIKIINGCAMTEKDIFVVSGEVKGYGYAIWRMDHNFENPKQVMSGVRGCCGQMDIQATGNDLWVAQNCDHKVGRYDRDGKKVATFGKRGREGEADCFGSCCNPMNIHVGPKGMIYTAESEGIVRVFSPEGESKGAVGSCTLKGGCKNVALAVSPDGNTVYFCDQPGSRIIVMTRKAEAAKGAN